MTYRKQNPKLEHIYRVLAVSTERLLEKESVKQSNVKHPHIQHFKSVPWVCPINAGNECWFSHFPFGVFWLAYFVLVKAESVSQLSLLSGYSDPPPYYETSWWDTHTSSPHLGIAPEAPKYKLSKFSHNKERESLATTSSFTSDSRLTPTECFGFTKKKKANRTRPSSFDLPQEHDKSTKAGPEMKFVACSQVRHRDCPQNGLWVGLLGPFVQVMSRPRRPN